MHCRCVHENRFEQVLSHYMDWFWQLLPAACRGYCYWMRAGLQQFHLRQQDEMIAEAARNLAFEIDRGLVEHVLGAYGLTPTVAVDRQSGISMRLVRSYDVKADVQPMTVPLEIRPPGMWPAPSTDRIGIRYVKEYDIVPDPRPVRDDWFWYEP